jgi:ABC-type Mn2+/Zn2+ transport system ATPase subunit
MTAPPALVLEDAAFGYEGRAILTGVSFQIARGEFLALVGPNGAGKTTLLRGILGLVPRLAGRVEFGFDRVAHPPGYVPQKDGLDAIFPLTAHEVVLMGTYARLGPLHPVTRMERAAAADALAQVGLAAVAEHPFWALSGGQKQRVLIARALAAAPEVIFLDEPTAGVDPGAASAIVEVIGRLNRERGLTVLLVSHHLRLVRALVPSVVWVDQGRARKGPTAEMLSAEHLERAFGLLSELG